MELIMARHSRVSKITQTHRARARRADIDQAQPEDPFHIVTPATPRQRDKMMRVPTLILRGEWLKAAGFPIGSDAYVIVDRNGELALHRSGLRFPRKMRVIAKR